MKQFHIHKDTMKYLTDNNLSLNAKGFLSIVLFNDGINSFDVQKYCTDNKVMFFNDYQNRNIVRVFPIEDYKKKDKLDTLELGVIYIGNNEKCLIDNKEDLFNTIPERTNCITYELDEDIKKRKQEIEKEIKEFREKIMNK